jgi:hypothetical protein
MSATSLGDTNGARRGSNHRSPVAYNKELGLFGLTGNQRCKSFNIHAIKEAIHLVEGIKG